MQRQASRRRWVERTVCAVALVALVTASRTASATDLGDAGAAPPPTSSSTAPSSAPSLSPSSTAPPRAAAGVVSGSAPIVVWPTTATLGGGHGEVHRQRRLDPETALRAQELDATLRDGVQDLGFALNLSESAPPDGHSTDLDLVARANAASPTWVVAPRLELAGTDAYVLTMVAAPPRAQVLRLRVERVKGPDVAVRGLVMLRELLSPVAAAQAAAGATERERIDSTAGFGVVARVRSQGRAILATGGTLFGAFTAYGLQRASGNEDPRVLYPLLAVGAGVGLGGSLLAAEEWDLSEGDAWFLTGGTGWAVASGVLLASGYEVRPLSDRYNYGAGAGFVGLGLATFALTRTRMDDGDAALLHSGAALGLGFGALGELFVVGSTTATPSLGAGYGTAAGLAGGGLLASFVTVPASRVLLVDVGAGLGGLAGAALGSPLVFEDVTPGKARGFLAATAGGALAGTAAALFFTRGSTKRETVVGFGHRLRLAPTLGAVPGATTPAFGGGLTGVLP